jgi:Glycosyltransferase family 87
MGVDAPGSTNTRFGGEAGRSGPARSAALAAALGSTGVLLAASVLGMVLGFAQKSPCRAGAWNSYASQFQHACYTDIYPLYYVEKLSAGKVPYAGHPVEYPVLIGGAMQAVAWLVRNVSEVIRGREFFDVTVLLLAVCAVAGVLATARAAGPDRRAQALMVALSPALILSAFVNWDLIALALTALGIAAWAARRSVWAGVLLGLAVATKFYPLVVFGPLLLLCLRAGQLRELAKTVAAAVLAWLAVNLPVMIVAPSGWARFYTFSKDRGADWGSIWYLFEHYNVPVLGNPGLSALNKMSAVFFAVACAAIAVLALAAPRRPRLPQLCFLVLAAFLMTNKVWSPQYVIWLVPLAVLARPRLWPYLLWQLAEVAYFFGIWGYLIFVYSAEGNQVTGYQGISTGWYFATLLARLLAVGLLAAYVVRDIINPERDPVRALGHDDPAGGVLNGAPDSFRLRLRSPLGLRPPSRVTPRPLGLRPPSRATPRPLGLRPPSRVTPRPLGLRPASNRTGAASAS